MPSLHPPSLALTPDIKDALTRSVLCWLATVDANGQPNVSPKEVFAPYGDSHLLIAHIASPQSVKNIRTHPHVCVSFVDVFVQKGFKLSGTAQIVDKQHPAYAALSAPLETMTHGVFPIHSVIYIHLTAAQEIVAPSYWLFPQSDKAQERAEKIRSAMTTYGVRPS